MDWKWNVHSFAISALTECRFIRLTQTATWIRSSSETLSEQIHFPTRFLSVLRPDSSARILFLRTLPGFPVETALDASGRLSVVAGEVGADYGGDPSLSSHACWVQNNAIFAVRTRRGSPKNS
jgi:hypothetical protein